MREAGEVEGRRWLTNPSDPRPMIERARSLSQVGEHREAARCYEIALSVDPERARWHHELATAHQHAGDDVEALLALQRAIDIDPRPAWTAQRDTLAARAASERGGFTTALWVAAAPDSAAGWTLANDLADQGRWEEALRLLGWARSDAPFNGAAAVQVADLALELCRWQGTLVGDGPGPSDLFRWGWGVGVDGRPGPERGRTISAGIEAMELALREKPDKASWHVKLGQLQELAGQVDAAIASFERALELLASSNRRWALRNKLPWQFRIESAYASDGRPRVEDPLFECSVDAPTPAAFDPVQQVVGLFDARVRTSGIVIEGLLTSRSLDPVNVLLDGSLLRRVRPSIEGALPRFTLPLTRSTVAMLPRRTAITVTAVDGSPLSAPGGATQVLLDVPHGEDTLKDSLRSGRVIDKKGSISLTRDETRAIQDGYLDLYARVNQTFEDRLGVRLFLMYGTLLGVHRDGELIPDDDDFDAGYVSELAEPAAVKQETLSHILELLRAGFDVSFNRRGRLFRATLDEPKFEGLHLDLRPVWFADGRVWAHNHASFVCEREDFLPLQSRELRGIEVHLPRHPEVFLEGHYGPGWKVPDPGFMYYADDVDPMIKRTLEAALMTPKDVRRMEAAVAEEAARVPGLGRFTSIGSQDLYPLRGLLE